MTEWMIVYYDGGNVPVRINADFLERYYPDFKYVNFAFSGKKHEQHKRDSWCGEYVSGDYIFTKENVPTYYDQSIIGQSVSSLQDITEDIRQQEIRYITNEIRNATKRLHAMQTFNIKES